VSKIYKIVSEVDIVIAIKTILKMIIDWLELPVIPIIIYTDLYSLYKCLVKLSTIKEKHLIIDIMALRQSYNVKNSLRFNGLIAKIT
jgi:hypothetical protein